MRMAQVPHVVNHQEIHRALAEIGDDSLKVCSMPSCFAASQRSYVIRNRSSCQTHFLEYFCRCTGTGPVGRMVVYRSRLPPTIHKGLNDRLGQVFSVAFGSASCKRSSGCTEADHRQRFICSRNCPTTRYALSPRKTICQGTAETCGSKSEHFARHEISSAN